MIQSLEDIMEDFMKYLAERFTSENNISDFTWALCRSNASFQKIFIDFCFESTIPLEIDSIEREFSEDNSRPDFLITDIEGNRYLLEVKKYDKNIHIEYKNISNIAKCAFIAIYKAPEKNPTYQFTKTWHGFIDHLEKEISGKKELINPLIDGYLNYLKAVTNYFKGETMNLSNLNSLYVFVQLIKEIIEKDNRKPKKYFKIDEGFAAFKIEYKEKNQHIHFHFGLGLWKKEPFVFIQFQEDTSKGVKEKILKIENNGIYYDAPIQNLDGHGNAVGIDICLEKTKFQMLCDENVSFDKQKEILNEYYGEVLKLLK
jgi:hypothetical protein